MVDIIFSNNKLLKRDSKLAENKKCPIQGLLPEWANCEYRLDRVVYEIASFTMLVLYQT